MKYTVTPDSISRSASGMYIRPLSEEHSLAKPHPNRTRKRVNGIYKLRAHAHRHGGSMGAYGTSQGGGAWGGRSPPSLGGGVGGYPPSR